MLNNKPARPAVPERRLVLSTERLLVYVGDRNDVDLFYRLWNEPKVMANVGYPLGLQITREEIATQLQNQEGQILDARLVIVLKSTGHSIGECKLGAPDECGTSTTDVKLLPAFWGKKYGVEIKRALVDYLFRFTSCMVVEATPNINNIASIKMQEAVGGIRVGEKRFKFPESKREFTQPVHSYVYHVYRDTWLLS